MWGEKNPTKCALSKVFQTHACLYSTPSTSLPNIETWLYPYIWPVISFSPKAREWENEAGEANCGLWVKSSPGSLCIVHRAKNGFYI